MCFALYVYIITFVLFCQNLFIKLLLKNNVLFVYNPKTKCICICTHGAIYVFCLICLNHNIYFVLSKFVYKAVRQKCCMFVLVYNLQSKSFCIHSILYVLCLTCLIKTFIFVLLKFEKNIYCQAYTY